MHFQIIRPSDGKLVYEWRKDPVTQEMSVHEVPATYEEFHKDFIRKYFEIYELPPLLAVSDEKIVGVLRFNPTDVAGQCEISINVNPACRGQGIGTEILQQVEPLIKRQGFSSIYAHVKNKNVSSQKAFEKAGYKKVSDEGYIRNLREEGKVFIIAEAGSNWRVGTPQKDLEQAYALIDAAKEAGADAVKFQVFKADTIYVSNAGKSDYLAEDDIFKLFQDLQLPDRMVSQLANHCKEVGIEFMATAFSTTDFTLIDPYVKRHKIASYEISHPHLLKYAAKSGKPTYLSTGASTYADIDWAVEKYQEFGGNKLALLQCTAKYPAEASQMHLNVIKTLQSRYELPVGLSDHSANPFAAPLTAVALGAKVVEKHFTLSRKLPGPDHSFAIEPDELKQMVLLIRDAEKMLSGGRKELDASEQELYEFARRKVQAKQMIRSGERFEEGKNIAILRPGNQPGGVHPKHLPEIEGKVAKRDISLGEGIKEGDW